MTVLAAATSLDSDVVALQETRHYDQNVAWAKRVALQYGYNASFSPVPNRQGGTALLWKRSLGRCAEVPWPNPESFEQHRRHTRNWEEMTITSAYGPCSEPDEQWLSNTCSHHDTNTQKTIVYVGDFNWRKPYDGLTHDLHHGPPTCTTTMNTAPTRILANRPISCVESLPMPGIPHHYLVTYDIEDGLDISDQSDPEPPLRPRRCAQYRWTLRENDDDDMVLINEQHALEAELNQTVPSAPSEASLSERWRNWHSRCETRFQIAERMGYCTKLQPAERTKGLLSFCDNFKQVDNRPPHFKNQSLTIRRLRRVHRAISDRLYHSDADDQPAPRDLRRLQQLVTEGLLFQDAHTSAQSATPFTRCPKLSQPRTRRKHAPYPKLSRTRLPSLRACHGRKSTNV